MEQCRLILQTPEIEDVGVAIYAFSSRRPCGRGTAAGSTPCPPARWHAESISVAVARLDPAGADRAQRVRKGSLASEMSRARVDQHITRTPRILALDHQQSNRRECARHAQPAFRRQWCGILVDLHTAFCEVDVTGVPSYRPRRAARARRRAWGHRAPEFCRSRRRDPNDSDSTFTSLASSALSTECTTSTPDCVSPSRVASAGKAPSDWRQCRE